MTQTERRALRRPGAPTNDSAAIGAYARVMTEVEFCGDCGSPLVGRRGRRSCFHNGHLEPIAEVLVRGASGRAWWGATA